MDESWYEKAAKRGLLGSKAKISAEAGKAPWSNRASTPEKARSQVIETAMKPPKKEIGG